MPIQVFLSRPTSCDAIFNPGLAGFRHLLEGHGLSPRTLGVSDYPTQNPLGEVASLLRQCRGAIILGVPQIRIEVGSLRGEPIESFDLPTEWNHIEAALAHSLQRPLLLIHHRSVTRGVFDRGATDAYLYAVNMADPSWPLSEEIQGALRVWKQRVLEVSPYVGLPEKFIDREDAKYMKLEEQIQKEGYRLFWCNLDELDRCVDYLGYERILWPASDGQPCLLSPKGNGQVPLKTKLSSEEVGLLRKRFEGKTI